MIRVPEDGSTNEIYKTSSENQQELLQFSHADGVLNIFQMKKVYVHKSRKLQRTAKRFCENS
uniref:Uncharacterized protein n=1 Tax=Romanomermis culicivorax TaxID=13658 RepID=A0A915K4H3_ROMCU